MKVDGRCHCARIVYEADVEPGTVAICNCSDCQMMSGSAFRMTISCPIGSFRIISGAPKLYVKVSDSGIKRVHAFCENCGGPIYSALAEQAETVSLRVGALKQRHELGGPRRQIWTKRRFDWMPPIDRAQEFEGQP